MAEKINEQSYHILYPQLFNQIQKICKFLPCPECSKDSSIFLAKIKLNTLKNKNEFKNLFYLFHNWVNAKKRKPLFNYSNMAIYKNLTLVNVINKFISIYNTKGNMKQLSESFQRQFVLKDFKRWITNNMRGFFPSRVPPSVTTPQNSEDTPAITQDEVILENDKVEEPDIQEPKVEEPEVEEPKVEEPEAEQPKVEEPEVEELEVEEPDVQEPKVEEPEVEEQDDDKK
jgi:hypothetical protein